MKFTVYQPDLSDEDYENPSLRNLYLDCIMNPTPEAVVKAANLYSTVAVIEAENFNHVFEIGNIGPVKKIEKLGRMKSVSVCDVIKCQKTGVSVIVAPVGFEVVSFGE